MEDDRVAHRAIAVTPKEASAATAILVCYLRGSSNCEMPKPSCRPGQGHHPRKVKWYESRRTHALYHRWQLRYRPRHCDLPLMLDVRDAASIQKTIATTAQHFGGIDICINNASAIDLSKSLDISVKRFDLIQQINLRAAFLVSRTCVPNLRRGANPHILSCRRR